MKTTKSQRPGIARFLMLAAMFFVPALDAAAEKSTPPTPPSTVYGFVGYTDEATNALPDTINGAQGMLNMHALCQDDFGPLARTCTEKEFWLSPNARAPLFSSSWVHPIIITSNLGFLGSTPRSCDGWRSLAEPGYVVTQDGKPDTPSCGKILPVTCCAPVQ